MDDNELKRLAELAAGDQEDTAEVHKELRLRRFADRWIDGYVYRLSHFRQRFADHPELENVAEELLREYGEALIRVSFR